MASNNACVEWLQKRTNLEKTLLSLSSLLLLTLLLLIIVGIASRGKNSDSSLSGDEENCWSRECLQTAGTILSSMDHKVDPCADFYGFACGRFGSKPGHSVSSARQSTDSVYLALKRLLEGNGKVLEDLKSFYNSCVQFGSHREDMGTKASNFLNLMSELGLGVWPILDSLYDTASFSLDHTLFSLTLLDVGVVFKMEVVPDQNIAGSYLIKLSPGGPRESGRLPKEIRSDVHLRSSVLTSFMLLGVTSANTATDVQDILSVDSSFAAIEQDNSTICDEVTLSPQESISELNRLVPELNWAYIIGELRRVTGLSRPFAVELHCKKKIRDYIAHLNDMTIRSELNYIGWRFFSHFVEYVIPTFQKSQFGRSEQSKPRWQICLELMEKFASPLLAKALTVDKATQEQVETISKTTLTTTDQMVSAAKWLTDNQKSKIQEKLSRIQILYPFSEGEGDVVNINIPQVSLSNFTSVVVHLQKRRIIQSFKKLSQDTKSDETNAWTPLLFSDEESSPIDYTVPVYFDKIQSPFLRPHQNDWMNYGGFGVYVARKITEILLKQTEGVEDSLWNLWNENKETVSCFTKSYVERVGMESGIIEQLPASTVDGLMHLTFLERSSLEIAFQAAKSHAKSSHRLPGLEWSQEMFFIAHAQGLCDTSLERNSTRLKERFNSLISSFGGFTEAFSCKTSSLKCEIWA